MSYSEPAAVIQRTGVEPDDLGLETQGDLDDFIADILDEVTDLMNRKMRKDWEEDAGGVPPGVDGIAADAAANVVKNAMVTRQSPTVRIDDFNVRVATLQVLSPELLDRMALYTVTAGSVELSSGELAEAWGAPLSPAMLNEDGP